MYFEGEFGSGIGFGDIFLFVYSKYINCIVVFNIDNGFVFSFFLLVFLGLFCFWCE